MLLTVSKRLFLIIFKSGLNFADENEAANFQMAIENKLTERRLRRERRMASKRQSLNGLQAPVPVVPQQQSVPPMPQPVQQVHVPAHVYFNRYKTTNHIFYDDADYFCSGLKMEKRRRKGSFAKRTSACLQIFNTLVTSAGIPIKDLI